MVEPIKAGHRNMLLQNFFGSQRHRITDLDWQDVGPRFLESIPDGKYKGFTIAKWRPDLVYEYYRLSGRHERTGRPFTETLDQLGTGRVHTVDSGSKPAVSLVIGAGEIPEGDSEWKRN